MIGLYLLVEGPDDDRFCERIVKPALETRRRWVRVVRYAEMKKAKVAKFLGNVQRTRDVGYLLFADKDAAPCVSKKKEVIAERFPPVDAHRVIVVVHEIESWYLAGLSRETCRRFKMGWMDRTDEVDKNRFDVLIPRKFDSRVDWMNEILKHFSLEMAKTRNKSFKYFADRLGV